MNNFDIRDLTNHFMCDDRLFKAAGELLKNDYRMIYLNSWEFEFDNEKLKDSPMRIEECIITKNNYNELLWRYHNISYEKFWVEPEHLSEFMECSETKRVGLFVDSMVYKKLLKIDDSIKLLHNFYPFMLIHYEKNNGTMYLYDVHLIVNVIETNASVFANSRGIKLFNFQKCQDKSFPPITMDILYNKYLDSDFLLLSEESYYNLDIALKNNYKTKIEVILKLKEVARQKYLFTITLYYIYEQTKNDMLVDFITEYYKFADKWNVFWSLIYKYYLKKEDMDFDKITIYIAELRNLNRDLIERLERIKCNQKVMTFSNKNKVINYIPEYNVVFDKYKNDNYSQSSIECCNNFKNNSGTIMKFLDRDITKIGQTVFYDNMVCKNQNIPVSYQGNTSYMCFYGFSDNGDFTDYVDIIYVDGLLERIELALSDKNGFPCFHEDIAWTAPIVQVKEGIVQILKNRANVYRSKITLKNQKVIKEILFPDMPNMHIVKIELGK